MVAKFQQELREGLEEVEERFAKGDCDVGMRKRCKTYRVYRFVREEVGTKMLTGKKNVSSGEYIEKVYQAIKEGKIGNVIVACINLCFGERVDMPELIFYHNKLTI